MRKIEKHDRSLATHLPRLADLSGFSCTLTLTWSISSSSTNDQQQCLGFLVSMNQAPYKTSQGSSSTIFKTAPTTGYGRGNCTLSALIPPPWDPGYQPILTNLTDSLTQYSPWLLNQVLIKLKQVLIKLVAKERVDS